MSDYRQMACSHEFQADLQRAMALELDGAPRERALEQARRQDELAAALWKLAGGLSRPGCFAPQNDLPTQSVGC